MNQEKWILVQSWKNVATQHESTNFMMTFVVTDKKKYKIQNEYYCSKSFS